MTTISLNGNDLTLDQVAAICRPSNGTYAKVGLAGEARSALEKTRKIIDETWMSDDGPLIYGFNTGAGPFRTRRVLAKDIERLQKRSLFAHATGVGTPFDEDAVRAMILMRINSNANDFGGQRAAILDRLIDCLNLGIHPIVPQQGSVGASGDLAPCAHMAGGVLGFEHSEVIYQGRRMPAAEALKAAGLDPEMTLAGKDGGALINGVGTSTGLAALAVFDARRALKASDIALAMSLEAMRGELGAFDPRLVGARPHPGQMKVGRNVLKIVAGTRRCSAEAREVIFPGETRAPGTPATPRVQDVYSLRCSPQIQGPAFDTLNHVEQIVLTEVNSTQDNPLVFHREDGGLDVVCGGHFHGQYLAHAMDLLSIGMTDISAVAERRVARLIDPTMSYGLPPNLVSGEPGFNNGYSTVQCALSALVMENRHLSNPGSVDTIPGKGNVEDHVSNSTWCARKARTIVQNTQQVVGGELLLAAQALSLVEDIAADFRIGEGTRAALEAIRKVIPAALDGDRWYAAEMYDALELVRSGEVVAAVEAAVGPLD